MRKDKCNVTANIAITLRDQLVQRARQNDRTLGREAAEAIRRHVEIPPADGPLDVRLNLREVAQIIRERNRNAGLSDAQAMAMLDGMLDVLDEAARRRVRHAAAVVYGPEHADTVTAVADRLAEERAAATVFGSERES